MRLNHSSRFQLFLLSEHTLDWGGVFLNASHTVAAWEPSSGNQFSVFFLKIPFLLILFSAVAENSFSFYLHFQDNIPYHFSEKTHIMTAEGICFLFLYYYFFHFFFKKGEKKKPQVSRSMWLCLIPHSPRQLMLKAVKWGSEADLKLSYH